MPKTGVETSNYNKNLQNCLTNHLKIFEKEISPLHNPVYNSSINTKISFVKWILKTIKSDEKIPYETLVVMIDTEIIIYKTRLEKAKTRLITDKTYDAIQHLEWLRNLLASTHRSGFNEILLY